MKIGNINTALKGAPEDLTVKIKHAPVVEGKYIGYHVAEINQQVQAHVHRTGDELYHVLKGKGLMYVGKVDFEGDKPVKVEWETPVSVKPNDVFNIPEGYAHSLQNAGGKPLIIGFICPHTHLTTDRYIIDNHLKNK